MITDAIARLRRRLGLLLISTSVYRRKRQAEAKELLLEAKHGFKIIDVDNFGRDYDTQKLVEDGFKTRAAAEARCKELIAERRLGEDSSRWLTVRRGDYKLQVFDGY